MGCEFSDKIRVYKRKLIRELFDQLTDGDKNAFNRIYGVIDRIPEDETYRIYYHCKRAIKRKEVGNGKR